MKKKNISAYLLVLLLSLSLLLAGCGGKEVTTNESGGEKPNKVIKMKLQHHEPPGSKLNLAFEEWAKTINEKTNGQVEITVYPAETLGKGKDSYSMVVNGIADLAWVPTGMVPGKFPVTEVANLPMLGMDTAEIGSQAIWDLYLNNEEVQKEFSEVKVISIWASGYQLLAAKDRDIKTLGDLKGLKLRAGGFGATQMLNSIGAVPMNAPPPEIYENIEKGVMDGCCFDWQGINASRIYEVVDSALDIPLCVVPQTFLMNKKTWESLPEDVQKVFEEHGGATMGVFIAQNAYDNANIEGVEYMKQLNKTVNTLTPEEEAKWVEAAKPVWEKWVKQVSEQGKDGEKALAQIQEFVAKYRN